MVVIGAVSIVWMARDSTPEWTQPAPMPAEVSDRPVGGSVRIAVATPPEFVDTGSGGDTLRQLTLPSLFVAQPDGTWNASLVEPGSDSAAEDGLSARFKLRATEWSNGQIVGIDDLRRSADRRFVESVSGPDDDGYVEVAFTQKLPQWRNLWSGDSSITPPEPGLTAGPFEVAEVTSGYETVLHRSDGWFDAPAFLDEVRLAVVPNATTARELLSAGDIDVVVPPVEIARTPTYDAIEDVEVSVAEESGWKTSLVSNPDRLSEERKAVMQSAFPLDAFVNGALTGEAFPVDVAPETEVANAPGELEVLLPIEEPVSSAFGRALSRAGESKELDVIVSQREWSGVERAIGEEDFEVALQRQQLGIDPLPDDGDNQWYLWGERVVVASRTEAVAGVAANGFAPGNAWNAQRWWVP